VYFHSYTRRMIHQTERNRLLRTVIVAKRFDNKDSCVESKGDNDNHDDQHHNVGRCLLVSNARRIDEVGNCAVRGRGRRHLPVIHARIHVMRLLSDGPCPDG